MANDNDLEFYCWSTIRDEVLREIRIELGIAVELTGPLFNAVERGVISGIKRAGQKT